MATDACPLSWPALHAGSGNGSDGNVSLLVGGSLSVRGSAAGAEGVVVARGDATFAREVSGTYQVGVTAEGSQVPPHADSDMLAVGGTLTTAPGTHLDVGEGLAGDVVVGGPVTEGADADLHGGQLDAGVPDATAPYDALLADLPGKSGWYAALPATGTTEVTEKAITLTGDGVSEPQVFTVDGSLLGAVDGVGRSLQVLGVPAGGTVVVNLGGPFVDLDIDSLLGPDGTVIDPIASASFVELATHLVWNAPAATAVDIGGLAQLPGSLLVPSAPSTTTLAGAGANGRILVAGDLVHTGSGRLHSYPFLPDRDLGCTPEISHLGTLTLDVDLQDPGHVVPEDRFFQGQYSCELDGTDVTPGDDTWMVRAGADAKVLSDQIPVGAVCTVTERLEVPPAQDYEWAEPVLDPEQVKVAKRDPRGLTVTNRADALLEPPPPPATPPSDPTSTPTAVVVPEPPLPTTTPSAGPSSEAEPTIPPREPSPTAQPSPAPETATPTADAAVPHADPPRPGGDTGPFTTTAPFTVRGSFVWGPMLLLSVLTLLVRTRRRPVRRR